MRILKLKVNYPYLPTGSLVFDERDHPGKIYFPNYVSEEIGAAQENSLVSLIETNLRLHPEDFEIIANTLE